MAEKTLTVVSKMKLVNEKLWNALWLLKKNLTLTGRSIKLVENTQDLLVGRGSVEYPISVYPISSQDNTEIEDDAPAEYDAGKLLKFYNPESPSQVLWAPKGMAAQAISATAILWNCDCLDPEKLDAYDADLTMEACRRIVHEVNHTLNGVLPSGPKTKFTVEHFTHELRAWIIEQSLRFTTNPYGEKAESLAFSPDARRLVLKDEILKHYSDLADLYVTDSAVKATIDTLCGSYTSWDGLSYDDPELELPFPGNLTNSAKAPAVAAKAPAKKHHK